MFTALTNCGPRWFVTMTTMRGKGGVCGTEGDETVYPLIALFKSNSYPAA